MRENDVNTISIEEIQKSNQLKKETCKSCMEQLKDILLDKQLEQFEDVFYSAINGYILKRKESANGNG